MYLSMYNSICIFQCIMFVFMNISKLIIKNDLGRLLAVYLRSVYLEYVVWALNILSPLSSACVRNFNCLFPVIDISVLFVSILKLMNYLLKVYQLLLQLCFFFSTFRRISMRQHLGLLRQLPCIVCVGMKPMSTVIFSPSSTSSFGLYHFSASGRL